MENYLIVLIFIGSIIYKIYTGYKEETEKARKRIPNQAPIPQNHSFPAKSEKNKKIIIDIPEKTYPTNPILSYDEIPDEVRQARENRINKSIEIHKEQKTQQPIEFDLRQAVIQSIILERPYK